MAKIKVMDFLKDVELNRRRLIENTQNNGKPISSDASLTEAVLATLDNDSSTQKPIEVRFFDCDGTLLKREFVEYGGSVTPPKNPNYDPSRLTFSRWLSAIGERFTNLTHDIDYGAHYTINDNKYHLFCTFTDETGYTVSPQIKHYYGDSQTANETITVDWGDGSEIETHTGTIIYLTHTYDKAGDYEIIISPPETPAKDGYFILFYVDNTSSGQQLLGYGNTSINQALQYAYLPTIAPYQFTSSVYQIKFIVYEKMHYSASKIGVTGFDTVFLHDCKASGTISFMSCRKCLIIDNTFENSNNDATFNYLYTDKVITPEKLYIHQIYLCKGLKKLIILGKISQPNWKDLTVLESLQLMGLSTYIPNMSGCYNLKELIPPSTCHSIGDINSAKLENFIIPENSILYNSTSLNMYTLKELVVPNNFDQSISLSHSINLSLNTLLGFLQNFKDNSETGKVNTLTVHKRILFLLSKTYVKLTNGIWDISKADEEGAILYVEALSNKNWTLSSGSSNL